MTFDMRTDNTWVTLARVVDYDDPVWANTLRQEQTPYGDTWVDGTSRPGQGRLAVRVQISQTTRNGCDLASQAAMTLLAQATAFRDGRRSSNYLITQGILGEPKLTETRRGTARVIAVTLALRDPYWHATDNDGSHNLFPAAPGSEGTEPPIGGGAPQWGSLWT